MGSKCMRAKIERGQPDCEYHSMVKFITKSPITQHYDFKRVLGKGGFGQVIQGYSKDTHQLRAIKKIDRLRHRIAEPLILNEFQILQEMDHPNILKMVEFFEEKQFFYIVTEICQGKELFQEIIQHQSFNEADAAKIFYQIASAIRYLHLNNVMHRDIKPQNIIYDSTTKTLKLIDFGGAIRFSSKKPIKYKLTGSSYYLAPEVIHTHYNHKCDVWSAGVVLYLMLSGEPPFNGNNDSQVMFSIVNHDLHFGNPVWRIISKEAKDLISLMLNKNLMERPEMSEVMEHPWIKKHCLKDVNNCERQNLADALLNMEKFKDLKPKKIQKGVIVFIINFIKNSEEEGKMLRCFQELDSNGDGVLTIDELSQGLSKYLNVSHNEAQHIAKGILSKIDTDKSGHIKYSEFVVSASNIKFTLTHENLQLAFDCLDVNSDGSLSLNDLQQKLGTSISKKEYEQVLKELNLHKKELISKQDFIRMMKRIIDQSQLGGS